MTCSSEEQLRVSYSGRSKVTNLFSAPFHMTSISGSPALRTEIHSHARRLRPAERSPWINFGTSIISAEEQWIVCLGCSSPLCRSGEVSWSLKELGALRTASPHTIDFSRRDESSASLSTISRAESLQSELTGTSDHEQAGVQGIDHL